MKTPWLSSFRAFLGKMVSLNSSLMDSRTHRISAAPALSPTSTWRPPTTSKFRQLPIIRVCSFRRTHQEPLVTSSSSNRLRFMARMPYTPSRLCRSIRLAEMALLHSSGPTKFFSDRKTPSARLRLTKPSPTICTAVSTSKIALSRSGTSSKKSSTSPKSPSL